MMMANTEMTTLSRVSGEPLATLPGTARHIPRPCLHGTHERLHDGGWLGLGDPIVAILG